MSQQKHTKKKKAKKPAFNMHRFMNKHRKPIVGAVCGVLVITLVVGVLASVALF